MMFVTILVLITFFLFHLNLSSNDINLQLIEISTQPTTEVSLQIETVPETNHPTFELSHRIIYPSQTLFREFIVPTLNSEKICDLYKFFYSKDPSISHLHFLPAERFFKTHPVLTTENEQNILYNFLFGRENPQTQFSKFKPIVYNRTNKTLETINQSYYYYSRNFADLPDRCPVANIGKEFLPFCQELNTKPLGDENKTVMIAIEKKTKMFFLILEDITNKNLKQYSVICYGQYEEKRNKSILLFQSRIRANERENIEYPKDIDFILKAKFVSGIKKYFFKFQYGHIKFCQKFLKNIFCLIVKLDDSIDNARYRRKFSNLTKLQKVFEHFFENICFLMQAYIFMTPYKAIIGAVFSPLYFYYSPQTFFLAFNLEPFIAAFFWGPTLVYRDLQCSRNLQFPQKQFRIYPLDQMFAIATLKSPITYFIRQFVWAWVIMIVCTAFVYCFLFEKKMPGEFLE